MERSIEPELLDSLPPDAPEALHNRRDLRWTNAVMRNHAWFARILPRLARQGERILEVGAGTGELGLRLASCGLHVDGLDLWPRPQRWPRSHAWHRADLRVFDRWADYPIVIGNLIFHQFSREDLRNVGARLQEHARLIIACEPHRRRVSQLAYRAIAPLLGANQVSLHDAHVSIAAGFRGSELADALGLHSPAWNVRSRVTLIGAYHTIAHREGDPL